MSSVRCVQPTRRPIGRRPSPGRGILLPHYDTTIGLAAFRAGPLLTPLVIEFAFRTSIGDLLAEIHDMLVLPSATD